MDYERIRNFILSYTSVNGGVLYNIRKKAEETEVPIIRKDTEDFLKVLIGIHKPCEILEVGTAVGYSTIFFAEELRALYDKKAILNDKNNKKNIINDKKWHIDTCEMDTDRISEAKKNISDAGFESFITIHQGDASDTLKRFVEEEKKYDFIFIDAAKAQYMDYLKSAIKLSREGTVIVTDNIFGDGDVLESHFLVEKRDRTIHDRMREYIYHITHSDNLVTTLVSVGDGLGVSLVNIR